MRLPADAAGRAGEGRGDTPQWVFVGEADGAAAGPGSVCLGWAGEGRSDTPQCVFVGEADGHTED